MASSGPKKGACVPFARFTAHANSVTKVKPSNASQQYRRAPKKLVKYHGLFGKEHHDAESEDVVRPSTIKAVKQGSTGCRVTLSSSTSTVQAAVVAAKPKVPRVNARPEYKFRMFRPPRSAVGKESDNITASKSKIGPSPSKFETPATPPTKAEPSSASRPRRTPRKAAARRRTPSTGRKRRQPNVLSSTKITATALKGIQYNAYADTDSTYEVGFSNSSQLVRGLRVSGSARVQRPSLIGSYIWTSPTPTIRKMKPASGSVSYTGTLAYTRDFATASTKLSLPHRVGSRGAAPSPVLSGAASVRLDSDLYAGALLSGFSPWASPASYGKWKCGAYFKGTVKPARGGSGVTSKTPRPKSKTPRPKSKTPRPKSKSSRQRKTYQRTIKKDGSETVAGVVLDDKWNVTLAVSAKPTSRTMVGCSALVARGKKSGPRDVTKRINMSQATVGLRYALSKRTLIHTSIGPNDLITGALEYRSKHSVFRTSLSINGCHSSAPHTYFGLRYDLLDQ